MDRPGARALRTSVAMTETARVRRSLVSLLCFACLACHTRDSKSTPPPSEPPAQAEGDSAEAPGFGPFAAPLHLDHPLVGRAWSMAEGAELSRAELEARLQAATHVLLGETHVHPDHHQLQGAMIQALLDAGQRPAVAYEMLDPLQQSDIDAFVASPERDPEAFAALVDWDNSGWPEWSLYRPAFAPALAAQLPLLAAQVPRSETKRYMSEGLGMLAPETVARYGLDQPPPEATQAVLLDEMFVAHCEMVPREQLAPMVEIQRIRDARMADAMLAGAAEHGRAVLVAGTGHTRAIGVPQLLELGGVAPESIVSLGFVSVDPERVEASDYGQDFDLIVFTPEVESEDPCAAMREQAKGE